MSTARHHRSGRGLFDQHSLALDEPKVARPPQAVTAPVLRRLWFCVYLPNLPLEAGGPVDEARAVVEEQHGIHRVLLADKDAQAAGIMPGLVRMSIGYTGSLEQRWTQLEDALEILNLIGVKVG